MTLYDTRFLVARNSRETNKCSIERHISDVALAIGLFRIFRKCNVDVQEMNGTEASSVPACLSS
jgi:hypothetical protein